MYFLAALSLIASLIVPNVASAMSTTPCTTFTQGLDQHLGVEGGTGAYSCPYVPR